MNAETMSLSRSTSAVSSCLRSQARGSIVDTTTAPPLRFLAVPLRMKRWSSRSRTFRWFAHHVRGPYEDQRRLPAGDTVRLYPGRSQVTCKGEMGARSGADQQHDVVIVG